MKPDIVSVLQGEEPSRMPVWFMRQAGRYLPEYRELRLHGPQDFVGFCLDPDLAAEATIQPIRRFDIDAAILFADILLIPYAMGQDVAFVRDKGPVLGPLGQLRFDFKKIEAVCETVVQVKEKLPKEKALIGFAGSPWTTFCYMANGTAEKGFTRALEFINQSGPAAESYLDQVVEATRVYLVEQIRAGVDLVQVFDSHSGLLEGDDFSRWVLGPTQRLVEGIKKECPGALIIGFPRGAGEDEIKAYAEQTGVDGLGLDQDVSLSFAKKELQPLKPLQGNLDPELLLEGGEEMIEEAQKIVETFGKRHIFNLGHGIIKETPPEHVAQLIAAIRQAS